MMRSTDLGQIVSLSRRDRVMARTWYLIDWFPEP
ncbi:hypothetical protein BMS3Bbin02_01952 [bacterium BMS3Bbin02]|nr:hypothetical protein BMS3Bbin02_01952 [bacterium BMS3Bbin02]